MAESWYVPVAPEFDELMSIHIFRAGVPDDVYAIPFAWQQEEVEFGMWILHFREDALNADQRTRMTNMGCVPVNGDKPAKAKTLEDRQEKLKKQQLQV
jgi:hypothetical protein